MNAPVETTVSKTRPESKSLRTVIPAEVVTMLRLQDGDRLSWDFEVVQSEIVIKLRKKVEK
jgi:antitoxin component of MazEF toxin-antitoxin module